MTLTRRAAVTAGVIFALPSLVHAQAFPTRPVRLIVPIAPGGANDIIARLIAERLAPVLGQPIIVENQIGVSGRI